MNLSCSESEEIITIPFNSYPPQSDNYLPLTPLHPLQSERTCDFSPLLQLDGNDSIISTPPHHSPQHPPQPVGADPGLSHPSALGVRQKTYAMNKGKQVKKLGKDTFKEDISIKVSPNSQNVSLQCNTGFYMQVVIPSLKGLVTGHNTKISGIDVTCSDIVGNIDAGGADLNTVLHFRFHHDKLPTGGVAVHLHHTTRLIQVQGGSVLPDKSHAPVWFVHHYLKSRLSRLSAEKAQEVSLFNQQVQNMVSAYVNLSQNDKKCAGCEIPFNKRSVPELCQTCCKYYHKYKCFPSSDHPCHIKHRSRSCSSTPLPLTSAGPSHVHTHTTPQTSTTYTPLQQSQLTTTSIPESEASVNAAPLAMPPPIPGPSVPLPIPHSQYIDLRSTNTSVQGLMPPILDTSSRHLPRQSCDDRPGLNPSAPPFVCNTATNPKPSKNNGKGSKNKAAPDLTLEFAQYTVNVSQAKIKEQEVTIKDLRFKNEILEARVVDLEKKQKDDIYNRYFPLPGSAPTQPSTTEHEQGNKHVGCNHGAQHLVLPCGFMKQNCCHPQYTSCQTSGASTGEESKKIAELKSSVDNLKYQVDLLTEVTIPQLMRTGCQNGPHQPAPVTDTESPPASTSSDALATLVPHQPDIATPPVPPPTDPVAPPPLHSHASPDKSDLMNVSQMTIDDEIHDVSTDLN